MNKSSNPDVQKLHDWIDQHADQIVSALQGVLRIPSLKADAAPNAPFGPTCREALDYTLDLCSRLGFRTKDVEGYAGHAEFGEGAEYVGVLGHLDVVPEGDDWQHPPYGAVLEDGYLYARGSSDDKGPTYAALFAAKAILDSGLPLKRRIRVIFGCDEESGFGCVHHYFDVAKEERPVLGFTPDASFPLIYAEKGIANLIFEKERGDGRRKTEDGSDAPNTQHRAPTGSSEGHQPSALLRIVQASGGLRANMVPDHAEATLAGPQNALGQAAAMLDNYWDRNVTLHPANDTLKIVAHGKSAHGSRPTAGDNAVARLARVLATLDLPDTELWLDWISETVDPTGQALGIAHTDDVAGPLTNNLGILEVTEAKVRVTYNIRYPVTWNKDALVEANKAVRDKAGWTLAEVHDQAPLHVPLDQEPVATLLRVYRENTGDTTSQPTTMGGGTYARATPHIVAYGAGFPDGDDGPAHEPDERIAVATVLNAAKIYAQALYEMAK